MDAVSRAARAYQHAKCQRPGCGHLAGSHRLHDAANVSPTDPHAEFRCLGEDRGSRFAGCAARCPDFLPDVSFAELVEQYEHAAV